MFAYVKGILIQTSPMYAVVEAHGVGYKIFIPASVFAKLPEMNQEILLHTSFVVRESSQTLYGFLASEERDLFEELTSVSGIGPKVALSLIGHLPISDFHRAIETQDITAINKVPGIGKKTAQRLIIEMKDKLAKTGNFHTLAEFAISVNDKQNVQKIRDAMNALINLGYNQMTAQMAIKKSIQTHSESIDLPSLIADALKHI